MGAGLAAASCRGQGYESLHSGLRHTAGSANHDQSPMMSCFHHTLSSSLSPLSPFPPFLLLPSLASPPRPAPTSRRKQKMISHRATTRHAMLLHAVSYSP